MTNGQPQELDALIERAVRGEAAGAEVERLAAWRAASPGNEREYARTVRLLEAAHRLGERAPVSEPPSVAALLARPRARRSPRVRTWLPWGVAAAAVLALFLLPRGAPQEVAAPAVVRTGAAELATVELDDGSVVRLGPSSRLHLRAPDGERGVLLEGRAFFNVARGAAGRFRVRTPVGDAVVLGTRFEVDADQERLQLLVVEGRVALSAGGRDVEVEDGERSGIVGGAVLEPTRVADADRLVEWAGKFLVFRSTPLRDAVAEVERVYGVRVRITDSVAASRTVTATFVDQRAPEVLNILCSIGDLRCRFDADSTVISP